MIHLPVVLIDLRVAAGGVITLTFGPAGNDELEATLTVVSRPGAPEHLMLAQLDEGDRFDLSIGEPTR